MSVAMLMDGEEFLNRKIKMQTLKEDKEKAIKFCVDMGDHKMAACYADYYSQKIEKLDPGSGTSTIDNSQLFYEMLSN